MDEIDVGNQADISGEAVFAPPENSFYSSPFISTVSLFTSIAIMRV